MDHIIWEQFLKAREQYRQEIDRLCGMLPELPAAQQRLIDNRSPSYQVETPIVYNSALDDIGPGSEIRLILVGDNPGRREQMAENRRYLVGPSGKIAEKFFRDNPSLDIDFRANVIILNKTPVHTPRTAELRELCRLGGEAVETAIGQSQRAMARLLLQFHQAFAVQGAAGENSKAPPVWITGYSEMKKGGIFDAYTEELKTIYANTGLQDHVFLYRHFSMNQFTGDLKQRAVPGEPLLQTLTRTGIAYRERFLW